MAAMSKGKRALQQPCEYMSCPTVATQELNTWGVTVRAMICETQNTKTFKVSIRETLTAQKFQLLE